MLFNVRANLFLSQTPSSSGKRATAFFHGPKASPIFSMACRWETDCFVDENTLTVNVNRLRKKLDSVGLSEFIKTKFGVGYIVE